MASYEKLGADAIAEKGWWREYRWLLLRRLTQLGILALFLVEVFPLHKLCYIRLQHVSVSPLIRRVIASAPWRPGGGRRFPPGGRPEGLRNEKTPS